MLLSDYLTKSGREESGGLLGAYVATEDGEARGKRNAMKEVTLKLLKRGIPLGIITDSTQLSPEEIRQIAKDNGLAF